jgi:hypothetical protein
MSQYEDDRPRYGRVRSQYNSPYGPVLRYGPINPVSRPRNIFDSTASAINADTARGIAVHLKNDVDMVWLDKELRELGVTSPERIRLFSTIETQQRAKEKVEMTASELISFWSHYEGERLRFHTGRLNNGWLTDVLVSNQRSKYQSEQDVIVVVDGKARFLLPSDTVTAWPNYVDDEE